MKLLTILLSDFAGIMIIIIGMILSVAIIIIFFHFYSQRGVVLRNLKRVESKDPLLIKDQEYAKVIGTANSYEKVLLSPIGNRKCVYYQVRVQKKVGDKNQYWKTIIKEEKSENFVVEVSDKKIVTEVDIPQNQKKIHLIEDIKYRSGTWNDATPELEKYLRSKGEKSTGLFGFNKTLRYHEAVIEIGEEVAVLGVAQWKKNDLQWDRYSSDTLFLTGNQQHKLIVTDDPKATRKAKQ